MLPEILLFVPAFAILWVFVGGLASLLSGWEALARHYRTREPFEGTQFSLNSGVLGWMNYNGILMIGVNADGLRLSVLFLFRLGHPPLFIPWSDIDAEPAKGWLLHYLDLRFRQVSSVRLRISRRLGEKILAAANRSWPADPPPSSPTE